MTPFDPRWGNAIASIESGGESSPYTSITPNPGGRRALGKYQVMEENLPEWTQAALGRRLSTQEFLNSPDAQEEVFKHRFGSYVDRYGTPQDAASAWFTGRPISAASASAHDSLGTSGASYVAKFNKAIGSSDGVSAIQHAMNLQPQGGGSPMAYADDEDTGTGALSTNSTVGPGVLLPGNRTRPAGGGLENGLMGAAAALASVYSPQQGAVLAGLRKDPADAGYTLHVDPKTGVGLRMSKDGQITRFQAFTPTTDIKDDPYQVSRAKSNSDLTDKIDADASSAQGQLAQIQQLKTILSKPDVYQGAGGESVASLKKIASNIPGLDIKGVADADVARSIMSQMTLGMRNFSGGMPGSLSDKDLAFLRGMSPNLNNEPGANQQILDTIGRVHQRSVDVQKKRDAYIAQHGRVDDNFRREIAQWANANPLFPDQPAAQPTATAAPAASKAAPVLPKGVKSIQVISQ